MPDPGPLGRLLGVKRPVGGALIIIGAIAASAAAAFAFTAGWLTPQRLTPDRMVDALSKRGGDPVGHRRNHAKGICVTGYFEASGEGARLSTAPMLVQGRYPVIGRFALAVGDPMAKDATARVRSLAVRITAPGGQEWRSGMIDVPFFPIATPETFYEQVLSADVDPRTGKPDPEAMKRFAAAHPEIKGFAAWAASAPWTASYADRSYNGLNAFRFVDRTGASRAVRWSMVATTPAQTVSPKDLEKLGPDFLETDLKRRLAAGELRWNLVATLAAPGDPTNDATRVWPADRPQVALGTLVVQKAEDEVDGPCRDFNYDPTILPRGIQPSDDPLLAARSATYAVSFDRRTAEAAHYPRTPRTQGASQ